MPLRCRRMGGKTMLFSLMCFSSFVLLFCYSLLQSISFNLIAQRSPLVNNVVPLTSFLSKSQHQLIARISRRKNILITQLNLSSTTEPRYASKSHTRNTNISDDDLWENLEIYTLSRPSEWKIRRNFRNQQELDEKFLRNDERSIERIVDGLAMDGEQDMNDVLSKKGAPKKRFPGVIIIGVKKGGTRALLEILKLHPLVCASGPEIHYFDRYYKKAFEWYREKMPLCYENEIVIEKTPSYFVTNGVAEDIFQYSRSLNISLKLLVIVRDPTTRAISDYTQTAHNSLTKKGYPRARKSGVFEDAALKYSEDGSKFINKRWGAIKIGVYSKHLLRWRRYFSPEQIHVVSGEGLIKQPYKEIKRVEKFLDLPPFIKPQHFVYNETKGFYCFDKNASSRVKSVKAVGAADSALLPLRCLGTSKGRTHVKISNVTEQILRDYFRPFNQELYDLIGRDLGWS